MENLNPVKIPLEEQDPNKLYFIDGREYKGLEYYNSLSGDEQLIEKLKCQNSYLYWVETYGYAPVTGGHIHMGTSEQWKSSPKFRILAKLFEQHDSVLLLSSRQIGKTTLGLFYALWAMIFFPKIQVMFLTLNTELAKDAVLRIKSMIEKLPYWMKPINSSKAEKTTFIDFTNGSKFKTSFISGAVDPNKAGRGLSQPIIILDEFAFCNHADIVYTSMQPSVATARIYAKKNGYPTLVLAVSTPNGGGDNQFYQILQHSTNIEDIYDFDNKKLYDNYEEILNGEDKNDFISVKIHWSETQRDEEWYKKQCKELNFNKRRINQELDLAFLGSSEAIFDDDIIVKLIPKKPIHNLNLSFGQKFKLFSELTTERVYALGVDTSASTGPTSDYSAISLVDLQSGQEVGAWKGRFAIVKQTSKVLKDIIKYLNKLYGITEENLIVIIERNSFGKGVVEELLYHDITSGDEFYYADYIWYDEYASGAAKGEKVPGFWTGNSGNSISGGRRDQMFSELMNFVNGYPDLIHSNELIDELRNLIQKPNGRIEAMKGQHDDIVMAFCMVLYVRKQMILNGQLEVDGEVTAFALKHERLEKFIDVGFNVTDTERLLHQDIIDESNEIINNRKPKENELDYYVVMI